MDEPQGLHAEGNEPGAKRQIIQVRHLKEVPGVVRFTETESRTVVARASVEGKQNCFSGYRISVLQDEKVTEFGCTTGDYAQHY